MKIIISVSTHVQCIFYSPFRDPPIGNITIIGIFIQKVDRSIALFL